MKTNAKYIKEFSLFDDVMTCIHESDENIISAVMEYTIALHKAEMESFFEAENDNTKAEVSDKKESIFSKIGNAIIKIINKLTDFVASVGEKLLGLIKKTKTDEEKVEKILKDHPELKDQVVNGINKEWFTYKDVATYEKDVVGLCTMLEKAQIDHKTFLQKMSEAAKKFNDSAAPILGAATTVIGFIGLAGKLKKNADDSKKALSSWKNKFKEFGDSVKTYKESDANIVQAVFSAYNEITAAKTDDCNKHIAAVGNYSNFLDKLLGKFGLGKEDREKRYVEKQAKDRINKDDRNNKIKEKIDKKYDELKSKATT